MGLVLCNSYPRLISAAITFYNENPCGGEGGNFEQMGWWNIEPGSCVLVYANDLAKLNRYWYYYAHCFEDDASWAGEYQSLVPLEAFDLCWTVGLSVRSKHIGYRLLDIGDADDYTLTFVE
jgi:uncharacterized membrane protein